MKSALIKHTADKSCVAPRQHSAGSTSIECEVHDEVGSAGPILRAARSAPRVRFTYSHSAK
jgi:hypothetical protein